MKSNKNYDVSLCTCYVSVNARVLYRCKNHFYHYHTNRKLDKYNKIKNIAFNINRMERNI